MNIINNKRIINVNCTWHNQETLFLGYSNDINSVELHLIIEPELLEQTENNFSYKIVFNRGTIGDTVKDDVTWSATDGLIYVIPPAITHFSNNDAVQGHQGYFQLFVMQGGNGTAATLVASSQKIPYIVADSLDLSATTVEDLGNTLWNAVQQAVAKIEALHFDTISLTNNDSYIPSSKLVKSLLEGKADIADISNKVDKEQRIAGIELRGDISADSLVNNIHSKINPSVTSGVSGYDGQYGINSSYNPVYCPHGGTSWTELAKISDLSGKVDKQTSLPQVATVEQQGQWVIDTTDSSFQNLAITQLFSAEISDVVYLYQKTGASTYILLTGLAHISDIPDISGKMDLAPAVTPSTIGALPSGQIYFMTDGVGIKNGSDTIELEKTSRKVTSINASSNNSQYPSAKAVYDLVSEIDISSDIKCYIGETEPPTGNVHASQIVPLPCIWYYNDSAWFIYGKTGAGTAGYYTYNMVKLAMYDDLPDVSGKADIATTLSGYGITDGMQLTRIFPTIDDNTQIKQGQIYIVGGEAFIKTDPIGGVGKLALAKKADVDAKENSSNKVEQVQDSSSTTQYPSIKAMTTYVTLGLSYKEATANRVTSIDSSSDNRHYPTAKAVKDYVDAAIAAAIQQLS